MCNREAAGVEQFARQNQATVQVVGVGTQDSLQQATAFVARYRMTRARMLWDSGFAAWQYYRTPGQPSALLLDSKGRFLAGYSTRIAYTDVLSRAKSGVSVLTSGAPK